MHYSGPERRTGLSEEQIEHIAELAAQKALSKVYAEVGKGAVAKIAWVLGAAIIGLLMWLGKNNISLK